MRLSLNRACPVWAAVIPRRIRTSAAFRQVVLINRRFCFLAITWALASFALHLFVDGESFPSEGSEAPCPVWLGHSRRKTYAPAREPGFEYQESSLDDHRLTESAEVETSSRITCSRYRYCPDTI
jgi:hypothetical protein